MTSKTIKENYISIRIKYITITLRMNTSLHLYEILVNWFLISKFAHEAPIGPGVGSSIR